jgi:hypothetical protein
MIRLACSKKELIRSEQLGCSLAIAENFELDGIRTPECRMSLGSHCYCTLSEDYGSYGRHKRETINSAS